MNKICTSLKQSKKLIEFGIDRKSSDMYYWCGSDLRIGGYKAQDEDLDIPAWSLSALLELMNVNDYKMALKYGDCSEYTMCFDDNYKYNGIIKDDALDAAFEMVCWLKENGKI